MSADNWDTCPRCFKRQQEHIENICKEAKDSYGRVTVDVFDDLRAKAAAAREVDCEDTLREDYELGVHLDGRFYVRYSGQCDACAFSHEFEYDQQLAVEE